MTVTSVEDVRAAYEESIPADQDAWLAGRIAAAERLLRQRLGDLEAWIGGDTYRREALVDVVCNMVLRLVRNPRALSSESETVGPFSYSTSQDARAASGTLWITDDDLALLGVSPGGGVPRTLFTRVAW